MSEDIGWTTFGDPSPRIYHGDCLEVLKRLPDCSVDAVVTDPPYGLSFMGKRWDYDVPSEEVWAECLRVLKPGGHLLAFAGTRTQHRMAVRIEDAGFEIRDMIAWVYGSGFPKSLDVSKAIDKAAGAERETKRVRYSPQQLNCKNGQNERPWMKAAAEAGFHELPGDEPATEAARQWQGWGTALKPSLEPVTVARKPLIGTVAANVLAHGTGGINVDGCRVGAEARPVMVCTQTVVAASSMSNVSTGATANGEVTTQGRWPANLIHDGSEEVLAMFPDTGKGNGKGSYSYSGVEYNNKATSMFNGDRPQAPSNYNDKGSAARFFYCAKASKSDRNSGGVNSTHPTVKPTDLMRYLCRLITPPGGTVLDPFMGSGSTGKAAILEGFSFIGIEREAEYVEIAKARIASAQAKPKQEDLF